MADVGAMSLVQPFPYNDEHVLDYAETGWRKILHMYNIHSCSGATPDTPLILGPVCKLSSPRHLHWGRAHRLSYWSLCAHSGNHVEEFARHPKKLQNVFIWLNPADLNRNHNDPYVLKCHWKTQWALMVEVSFFSPPDPTPQPRFGLKNRKFSQCMAVGRSVVWWHGSVQMPFRELPWLRFAWRFPEAYLSHTFVSIYCVLLH